MKYTFLLLHLISLFVFTSCDTNAQQSTQNNPDGKITIAEFKAKLAAVPNPQLIDVRTPEEFNGGTLDNAFNMDFTSQNLDNQLNTLDKSKPVFIFCQSGGRSGKCYEKMKTMGFQEVYDMAGGYGAWSKQ